MSGPDIHTLTGAYALDAVDELERRLFRAHLNDCPDCANEIDELRATATKLGLAVAVQAPDSLRRRVLAQVATTRQDSSTGGPALTRSRRDAAARHSRWPMRLTGTAAGLAAAVALVLAVITVRAAQQRDSTEAALAQVQAQYGQVAQLVKAADARGTAGTGIDGGTAFVLVSRDLNRAVLLVSGLPPAPPGRTYQAWLIGQGQPRSVGLMPAASLTRSTPLVVGGLGGALKIGLTIEPAGGSASPTTTPVVLFDLPA
jgi:anti-sigma-K factor RskA